MTEPRRFWSATTIIGEGSPKPQLVGWASRVTGERAYDKLATLTAMHADGDRAAAVKWLTDARWETTKSAALRGTKVHSIIEAYALGQTPDVPDEVEPWHQQIRRFLDDHQPEFEAAESSVFNLELGYAGTMDMILKVGGKRVIVDAKTTDKGPDARSRPPYDEVALQLAAYSRADRVAIGTPPELLQRKHGGRRYYVYDETYEYQPMPQLDGAFALVISPVDYLFVPVSIDDTVWKAFLAVREVARWKLESSRHVFGPAVTAPIRERSAA